MEPDRKKEAMTTLLLEKEVKEETKVVNDFKEEIYTEEETISLHKLFQEKTQPNALEQKVIEEEIIEPMPTQETVEVQEEVQTNESSQFSIENVNAQVSPNASHSINKEVKPKRNKKFRVKLLAVTYALVIGICAGWTIGNAIAINNQASILELTKTDYELNLKYIQKLGQLDTEITDDNDEFSPISSAVELQPLPLTSPTDYEKTSNWFDKLCNWLSNMFGR